MTTWSNPSFAAGLALGGGLIGILFLAYWLESRALISRLRFLVLAQDLDGMIARAAITKAGARLELEDWELREPGASDIGARLPLDHRG